MEPHDVRIFATAADFRAWLEEHHETAVDLWIGYYRKGVSKVSMTYREAVEEALCFGWIDSTANALDAERSMLLVTPRKPKSPWSRLNKQRVERLLAAGSIASAGLAAIAVAKANGSWTAYDAIEDLRVAPDLQAALAAHPAAQERFAAFGGSAKKQILWWVESAKRAETRTRRIAAVVTAAAQNVNPLAPNRRTANPPQE